MEDNSILEVLTQLESDLKDIKAAKEQIDDVLEADSEINENLADYSQQLASIATQLGSLKELKMCIRDRSQAYYRKPSSSL